MSHDQLVRECKKVIREGKTQNMNRSIVGLFSCFDSLVLERMVGTQSYRKLIKSEAKDSFTYE